MVSQANEFSDGTLFYLDNETPKGRYGHMWWVGYYPDMPAWHDYDQPFDRWMVHHTKAGDHFDEPMPYERRPYLEILSIQRRHGAMGFWAHPTSWWQGEAGQFITNIASEMPAHVMAQGYLDGMVIMGYNPFRPQYQAIWFALLDRGYRVPGVAEMDAGLSDAGLWRKESAMLTYVPNTSDKLTIAKLVELFRKGRMFASTGPMIEIEVDGQPMGGVVTTGANISHIIRITVMPAGGKRIGRVEIIGRGGEILWAQNEVDGPTVELTLPGSDVRGYFIARVFGAGSSPADWRGVRDFAITNPVYLHPRGTAFEKPMTTSVTVTIRPDSPFAGGEIHFESTDGELLGKAAAVGTTRETLPADGRLTLISRDGARKTDYLVNANRKLQDLQRYLYRGRFLKDFPSAKAGDVPVEAWRLDDFASTLRQVELEY